MVVMDVSVRHLYTLVYCVSIPQCGHLSEEMGEEGTRIGENVAALVPDGATIQVGIGALPEAILKCLHSKRDLGVHSGLVTDGILELIEGGVVTNARKSIDRGKTVTAYLMGSERLFRFSDGNAHVELRPVDRTHDVRELMQIDNLVAINSAVEIDLTGQVNAESLGDLQLSTVGGQADFTNGAALSFGGRSIIAMTSMARRGTVSRIVPKFGQGTIVTTPRYDVEYVVTEYGVANLKGKTVTQRARALISIAHPSVRRELEDHWERLFT